MNEFILKENLDALVKPTLKNMGENLIKKAPEVIKGLALISAKKEIAYIEISKAVAPVLNTFTDKFINYLKEANELATKAEMKNYDLITEVIRQHPEASFEEKVMLIKDNSDKKYNLWNNALSALVKVAGLSVVTVLGSIGIVEVSKCKQVELKEKGKTDRSFFGKKK